MSRLPASRTVLVVLLLLVAGCGEDDTTRPSPLRGPPEWWSAPDGRPEDGGQVHVRAVEPCAVTLVVEGLDGGPQELPPRSLAAGETVLVSWGSAARPDENHVPPAEELALGRTEALFGGFSLGYDDSAVVSTGVVLWTRPGAGRTARSHVLPPTVPEPLAFGEGVELSAVALAEVESGDVALRPSPAGHRLRTEPPGGALPTRTRVLRLKLKVMRPGESPAGG